MGIYSDLKFVQAHGHGGNRSMTQMVVIHATDNTASDEGEAGYASWRPDGTSAHFYNDEDSVTQALDTNVVAYGCYPAGNSRSVQFELCGRSNQLSDATLRRVAPIVARVCRDYGIPIRKISAQDLRDGVKGIVGHGDVTAAWGEGNHTDPGPNFPWAAFIGYVAAAAGQTPPPAPAPSGRAFQLPAGHCYGDVNGPSYVHGGYYQSERPVIRDIQNRLNAFGFGCGTADGVIGPKTMNAIRAFQRSRGLTVDALVGPSTWRALFG